MNVAIVHDLPSGGALRVLRAWAARTSAERLTAYVRDAGAALPPRVTVVQRPRRPAGPGNVAELRRLLGSRRAGRELAAEVDAGGHDVVFCFASRLTQAPDVLEFLRTPSLYYAPEPLRSAYEPPELLGFPDTVGGRITARGWNPVEVLRAARDRRAIRRAPAVVTHSQFTREVLRATYGVTAEVVLLGVDARAMTPGPGAEAGAPYVLAVGALHPLKGHELVVDAVAGMPSPRPALVVVGDRGVQEASLAARARAAGVALDIRQGIADEELLGLYRGALAVACGQIREPFGLTPLEAMACATPVVAVAEGGFRETIDDGRTGLLVARDADAMAAALTRLRADPALASSLGGAGRREVLERWTWERTAQGLDALLGDAARRGVAVGR